MFIPYHNKLYIEIKKMISNNAGVDIHILK